MAQTVARQTVLPSDAVSPVAVAEPSSPAPELPAPSSTAPELPALAPPVTVVEIGDSLGEDLGYGMRDVLAGDSDFTLVRAAVGDSGLVHTDFYDWPRHLDDLLAQRHPDVVVVFLGANDVQNFYADGVYEKFGSPGWQAAYSARVAIMMEEATQAGSRVLWVGMPIMRSATFSKSMQVINGIYEKQASVHEGVTYFSSWDVMSSAEGTYMEKMTDADGKTIVLRAPDGIHIAFGNGGGGADVLGRAVVKEMRAVYRLRAASPSAT